MNTSRPFPCLPPTLRLTFGSKIHQNLRHFKQLTQLIIFRAINKKRKMVKLKRKAVNQQEFISHTLTNTL